MNTFHKLSPFLLVVFIVFTLQSCGEHDAPKNLDSNDCRPQLTKCNTTVAGITAAFWLEQEEYANEIPLPINIMLSESSAVVIGSQLTGDNMYMGYIPVLLDQHKVGHFKGDMYLASCTQNDMRWILTLEVQKANAEVIEFQFVFSGPN
ncbi:hypothetical protein DU002_01555 [Corallincola holothuriorum]|uniref:Uncharacterized protein n=1 Tax=Corallincola holothuriorum TaxID=2282215 RepID=A0A368NQ30_9GAMM|nr:hypothetical protein [Corallincola holothuriorum]RCU52677.1 hypothetical protein DU002_01555 [Corallincola holothuriorum]